MPTEDDSEDLQLYHLFSGPRLHEPQFCEGCQSMIRGPHACPGPSDRSFEALWSEDASEAEVIKALNSPSVQSWSMGESTVEFSETLCSLLADASGRSGGPYSTPARTDAEFLARVAVLVFRGSDRPFEEGQDLMQDVIQAYLENHPATRYTPEQYRCFENEFFGNPKIAEFKVTRMPKADENGFEIESYQVAAVVGKIQRMRDLLEREKGDTPSRGPKPSDVRPNPKALRPFNESERSDLLKKIPAHWAPAEWERLVSSFGTSTPPTPEEEELGAEFQAALLQEAEEHAANVKDAKRRSDELLRVNEESRRQEKRLSAHVEETVNGNLEFDPKAMDWNRLAMAQTGEEAFNLFCALTGYQRWRDEEAWREESEED